MALCSGADSAYLFDLLLEHDRVHEYPRRESTASAWHLLGSAAAFAGGGLLAQIDLALPYLVTAVVAAAAAVVALCSTTMRPRRRSARIVWRSWGRQMSSALGEVGRNSRLAWLIGYSAVTFMLLRATIYVYQPYLHARGLGPIAIGVMFAGVYVVASFVAYRTHLLRRRFGDEILLVDVARRARDQLPRSRRCRAGPVDVVALARASGRERHVLAADEATAQRRDCGLVATRGGPVGREHGAARARWDCSHRSSVSTARAK